MGQVLKNMVELFIVCKMPLACAAYGLHVIILLIHRCTSYSSFFVLSSSSSPSSNALKTELLIQDLVVSISENILLVVIGPHLIAVSLFR